MTIFVCMELSQWHINTIKTVFTGLPVKKAYLFGSYSRNEANESSDIDILVKRNHSGPIGLQFSNYSDRLQKLLKKIDLKSYEGLSKYIKPVVDKEKVLVYGR